MLRDRYPAVDLFALVPPLTLTFEPVLAQLDRLLEDDTLFQAVKRDLARRRPRTLQAGRLSTPVEVILRLLIVRRLYGWSYAETEHFVGDSLVLRQFCRLGLERVPDDTTLLRWAALIQPATLERLLDHVVALAQQLKVTRGRKLRVDSTVVQTPIHYPTDSSLLMDSVRVLGRLIRRARPAVGPALAGVRDAFRTRTRSGRRQVQRIHRTTRQKGAAAVAAQRVAYQRLCQVARQVVRQAERVQHALAEAGAASGHGAERGRRELGRVLPLVQQVLAQTERRVLHGEAVPAEAKVVSLVEPHTAILPRHKAGRPVEFGHKLWLAEVEGGHHYSGPGAGRGPAGRAGSAPQRDPPSAAVRPGPRLRDRGSRPSGCAAWPCRTPGGRAPPAGRRSANAGSSAAIAGGPGLKAGSACCSGAMGSRAVPTTALRGWPAGSAGAC